MSLSINSNTLASSVANRLTQINQDLKDTAERIATGKKILRASDDPAGIGILMSMKSQQSSWGAVDKNLTSAQALLDVSSSALKNQNEILVKMKDLATQAASSTLSTEQRNSLQKTFSEMQTQLDTIVNRASIYGQNLVNSSSANVDIQSGISAGDKTTLTAIKSDTATLGVDAATVDLTDATKASAAITALDNAVKTVSTNQSIIGSQQTGIDSLKTTSKTAQINLSSSISNIEDADIATESTKLQLLQAQQQLGIQSLGIINQLPSYALSLLR